MVQKVGDRRYWEQWAKDVATIAENHVARINKLVKEDDKHRKAFERFLKGLQKNINPSINQEEAVDMLAQHIITKPVFEALFEGYSFVKNNPISISMQKMLDLLEEQSLEKDSETLQKFYESVKTRAGDIDNSAGKQKIIVELYDKFFKTAFPKMVEKLGIVYTPIELVDFIIYSVEVILQKEFSRSITDENIHFLDPFTGTGTFITRLLQSGLIKSKDLERKYEKELHANEIVLLAYYIAAINIENAFHDLRQNSKEYKAFDGICLTDTFQLGETDDSEKLFSDMFPQNSKRVQAQKKVPVRVIMGNPPYSAHQKSANDNAQNQSYLKLDSRIAETYVESAKSTNKNALYDSYIKAFRWSTDRLDPKNGGIIAFVSNGAWIDGNSTSGFRKCLEKDFSSIYIFNLRGNQRTSGELSRKEGGKIFGSGSRTPITITFLIKKPDVLIKPIQIFYHDIGDYLTREEKLSIIAKFKQIDNSEITWQMLKPNEHGDWLNQRSNIFESLIPVEPNKKFEHSSQSVFVVNSMGIGSSRDAWVFNSSKQNLLKNMKLTISFYNNQVSEYLKVKKSNFEVTDFMSTDATKISWSSSLIPLLDKCETVNFEPEKISTILYRPFYKQLMYYGEKFLHRRGQYSQLFPSTNSPNLIICISSIGTNSGLSVLISNCMVDTHFNGDTQCFPLYYYDEQEKINQTLFDNDNGEDKFIKRDGVSDFILNQAKLIYGARINKEDIFYYVYGILHSTDYRTRFSNDLKKMLPRIPLVPDQKEFWAFSKAGKKLADLHIGYEEVEHCEEVKIIGAKNNFFKVEKIRFSSKEDKSQIIFNSKITIENIPLEAYEYIVNGKSAIEWVMERYQVTIHKESGIKNDPNDWATENPRYILDLLLSIITVSIETMKIVKSLPALKEIN